MPLLLAAWLLCAGRVLAGEISATVEDQKGRAVQGAVVFIYEVKGASFKPPAELAVMDQIDKLFVPYVLPVLAGSRVRFPNKDNIHHHVYSFSKTKKFDLPLYKGEPAEPITLETPGIVKLGCNIHDWMRGFIVVLGNPYFALTGADGKAKLTVPAGSYQLVVWSDRIKGAVESTLQPVVVGKKGVVQESFKQKFGMEYVAHQHPIDSY